MSVIEIHSIHEITFRSTGGVERRTEWHELHWVAEGSVDLVKAGSTRRLTRRTVGYDEPGQRIRFAWEGPRNRIGCVMFGDDRPVMLPSELPVSDDDVTRPMLQHLNWLAVTRPPGWMPRARDVLSYVLTALRDGAGTRVDIPADEHPMIRAVIGHLRDIWQSGPLAAPALTDLARAANVSREHLCRAFVAELGHPPVAVARLLRLDRAASLLTQSDLPVRSIASECGFANEYHFSTAFKRLSGVSPREFRRQSLELELPERVAELGRYLR